jgi:hypothetical protein
LRQAPGSSSSSAQLPSTELHCLACCCYAAILQLRFVMQLPRIAVSAADGIQPGHLCWLKTQQQDKLNKAAAWVN